MRFLLAVSLLAGSAFAAENHAIQGPKQNAAVLAKILDKYKTKAPEGWRWVIVSEADWESVLKRFNAPPDFASVSIFSIDKFNDETVDATYINERIFAADQREYLKYGVAHELGHIACHTSDEAVADRAMYQIVAGKIVACAAK